MRRIVALTIALALTAGLGSITLARADCSYHKSQSALDKAKTANEVATAPAVDKTTTGQLQTAQSDKPDKPMPQVKN